MVSCKDFTAFCSHLPVFFVLFFKFLMLSSDLSYQEPAHYGAHSNEAAGGLTLLNGVQQRSWEDMQVVLSFHRRMKSLLP